jgi:LmbE family N-acetylglucosaminyl deacetylase
MPAAISIEFERKTTPIEEGWLLRFCSDHGARPSVEIVAAHPDDAVVGAAARLPRLSGRCRFVHVTDGAPRDMTEAIMSGFNSRASYARARRAELHMALARAGFAADSCFDLGVTGQEAVNHLSEVALALVTLLERQPVDVVVTHPYEGGHPDHDATALAVHAAMRLIERRGGHRPALVEMTSYHASNGGVRGGSFLPGTGPPPRTIRLPIHHRTLKREMLACFETQRHALASLPCEVERFRLAPRYDFTRAPHPGKLLYERLGGEMDGARWRTIAAQALASLALPVA